jgi:hypothetical protein
MDIKMVVNSKNTRNIQIHFDNGVIVQQRVKYGKNSSFVGHWWQLFKEEWTIIPTKEWQNTLKVIKL